MNPSSELDAFRQTALILVPEFILLATAVVIMTASVFIRRPRGDWFTISGVALLLAPGAAEFGRR